MQQTILIDRRAELSPRERVIADLARKLNPNTEQTAAINLDRLHKNELCDEEIAEVLKAAALFSYWSQQNKLGTTNGHPPERSTLADPLPYFFEGTA